MKGTDIIDLTDINTANDVCTGARHLVIKDLCKSLSFIIHMNNKGNRTMSDKRKIVIINKGRGDIVPFLHDVVSRYKWNFFLSPVFPNPSKKQFVEGLADGLLNNQRFLFLK